MATRLRLMLPAHWFADAAPVRDAFLSGIGAAWSAIYDLIGFVRQQTRVGSATGSFLDAAAGDFFGSDLVRRNAEADAPFVARVKLEMLRPRGTRGALARTLLDLTGQAPVIFEPARPADTGGYSSYALAYNVTGAWGSLSLPFQAFLTVFRPHGGGIATVAGYGSGGYLVYGDTATIESIVKDDDIVSAVNAAIPVGVIVWMRISDELPAAVPVS